MTVPSAPSPDQPTLRQLVEAGDHRSLVGGLWDQMGALQRDMLVAAGLRPGHRLLDIGCGSLRLGRLACAYLNPGDYWGTDRNAGLIEAGYQLEIRSAGLGDRLPRMNLVVDAEFGFDGLPPSFDFVMAQSVFTHLPLNHLRLCFGNLGARLTGPCTAFFTIFMADPALPPGQPCAQKDGIMTWSHKDPFHYDWDDIRHAFRGLPWDLTLVGDWAHPRNQMLVKAMLAPRGRPNAAGAPG